MRVVVCGGRGFEAEDVLVNTMSSLQSMYDLKIAHGGSSGADEMAHNWALAHCESLPKTYKAEWGKHGGAAGPIRNSFMLDDFKPDIVVAFKGGAGTEDTIKKARAKGITVIIVGDEFPI